MKVIGWKIWYTENRLFDSNHFKWKDLPDDGALFLMLYYDKKDRLGRYTRLILSGYEWYFSDGNQIFGGNNDFLEENKKRYSNCMFKRGKWTTAEIMEKINNLAINDYEI